MYRVDRAWSHDFKELSRKPNESLAAGGASGYEQWHTWLVLVPEGERRQLELNLPQVKGQSRKVPVGEKLSPGVHYVQMGFEPADSSGGPRAEIRIGKQPLRVPLPGWLADRQPPPADVIQLAEPGESIVLKACNLKGAGAALELFVRPETR